MSPQRTRRKSFQFETLEVRQAMAGDVTAAMANGDLILSEKTGFVGAAQAVEISQTTAGLVRVRGIAALDGGTSMIDGLSYRDFYVPGNITVNFGGGNDLVKFSGNGTFNGLTLNMGTDNVKVKQDDDRVFIDGISTRGGVRIETGLGKDYIGITDALLGNDYADNLIVDMGAGQDSLDVRGVTRTTQIKGNFNAYLYDASEADIDGMYFDNVAVWANFATGTGAGQDFVTINNFQSGGDILINTGADKDQAKLNNVQALDDFWAFMGDGDDLLELTNVGCDRMELYGEGGTDTLNRSNPGYVASQTQSGFEQGNAAPILLASVSTDFQ